MSAPKPAGGYRFEGTVVLVPARVAAWLARHTDLKKVRVAARGTDPELYAVLHDLYVAGLEWRTSATGSGEVAHPEEAAPSKWVSTTQAAELVGISSRAVRLAVAEQRLPAQQVAGRWRIAREDVEQYKAARAQAGRGS